MPDTNVVNLVKLPSIGEAKEAARFNRDELIKVIELATRLCEFIDMHAPERMKEMLAFALTQAMEAVAFGTTVYSDSQMTLDAVVSAEIDNPSH